MLIYYFLAQLLYKQLFKKEFKTKMNLFQLGRSSISAFVPYKPDSLDKTKNSNKVNFLSQATTVSLEYDIPTQYPLIVNILKSNESNLNCLEQKQQRKYKKISIKLKKGNEQNDNQYRPNKRITKKQANSKLNENRNILPNTIHQLFSFGQRRNRSGVIVQKILSKKMHPSTYSLSRFYIYQKHLKNKIGNYVTQDSLKMVCKNQILCQLFQQQEEMFYNQVFRMLVYSYLNQEANCSVLMSKRMYNDKKIQHIKTNRYIANRMKSHFTQ